MDFWAGKDQFRNPKLVAAIRKRFEADLLDPDMPEQAKEFVRLRLLEEWPLPVTLWVFVLILVSIPYTCSMS